MAKVKVLNLDKVQSRIRQQITKALRAKEIRKDIGQIVGDEIQKTNFGAASKNTVNQRKYLEKYNKTHPSYSRDKINITFTGDLMDDLRGNVLLDTDGGKIKYVIENSEKKHKRYKNKKGKGIGKQQTHKEIADHVLKLYKFDKFSQETINKLLKAIKDNLSKIFKIK